VLRHEFRPGRLVAGLAFTLAGVIYVGDAGGLWETPWFVVIPVVVGGLFLAGATGALTHAVRRRRGIRPGPGADASAGSETTA
jgi:hypothetical protein